MISEAIQTTNEQGTSEGDASPAGKTRSDVSRASASLAPRSRARVHLWFGVITLIYAFDFADRFLVSAILPYLKSDFHLTDARAGLLGGMVYLGLALFALPSGALIDRWSRKRMIAIMTSLWSLATWATGFARSYPALLASRLFVGVGEAGYNPAGYALIAAWYPQRLRGTMVGFFNVAQPVGSGLGMALAGYIADRYGWRHVFGVLAIPGFVLAVLVLFAPDFRTRQAGQGSPEARVKFREVMAYVRGNRTLQLIFAVQLPVGFYSISWATWSPSFFTRTFSISVGQAGRAVMAVVAVAALGPPIGGYLSDRWARRQTDGRLRSAVLFLTVMLGLHLILFSLAGRGLAYGPSIALAAVAQFFMAAHWGTLVAASLDLTPPHYRGTCQAFLPLAQGVVAFGSAALTGAISDRLGLATALAISATVGIGTALAVLAAARRSYRSDRRRREALGHFEVEVGA